MDVGKLHTPHDAPGCLYYFTVDDQHPDTPRREATRSYFVLATPSSSCSDAFLFLCRSLCPPGMPRDWLQRWYKVYETVFARLSFEGFAGLVRASPYWDRVTQTRKPRHALELDPGCVQLFTDESAARAALERRRQQALHREDVEPRGVPTQGPRSQLGCPDNPTAPPHRGGPELTTSRRSARPPSSATPDKAARESDSANASSPPTPASVSVPTSARTALPLSARPPPLGIPMHHLNSLEVSRTTTQKESTQLSTAHADAARRDARHHATDIIDLSEDSPTDRFRRVAGTKGVPTEVEISTPLSSIQVTDQLSAVASWPAESGSDAYRGHRVVPLDGLNASMRGKDHRNGGVVRERRDDRCASHQQQRLERQHERYERRQRRHREDVRVDYDSDTFSSSCSSSSSLQAACAHRRRRRDKHSPSHARSERRESSRSLRAQLASAQAALSETAAALARAQHEHAAKSEQWHEQVSRLRNELQASGASAGARLHALVEDNQKQVARIEASFAEKEAEIRHVYGLALQNRDVRLVQLSEELAVSQQRERERAGHESAQEAELLQLRQRLQVETARGDELQSQLRDMRQRREMEMRTTPSVTTVAPGSARGRMRDLQSDGSRSGNDELLDALRGVEQRYTASVLYAKKLEAEVDEVRCLLAEKDTEVAKAYALIQALQEGLRMVKLELPALREEWQRTAHSTTPATVFS